MRKIIATLLAAVYGMILVVTPLLAYTGPTDVTASVTVTEVCGLTIDNSAISFGTNVMPNTQNNSADKTVTATTDPEQNVNIDVTIGGTDWSGPGSMGVGQTKYSQDGGVSWNTLTGSAPLFSISTSHSKTSTFVLDIPNNQPAGSYTQTITYGFSCD